MLPEAIVGVAASLPDEEARQLLVTAVGRMEQQKPYAGLALAETYISQPEPTAELPEPALFDGMTDDELRAFLGEVAALQEADPQNALFDALRAGALFVWAPRKRHWRRSWLYRGRKPPRRMVWMRPSPVKWG